MASSSTLTGSAAPAGDAPNATHTAVTALSASSPPSGRRATERPTRHLATSSIGSSAGGRAGGGAREDSGANHAAAAAVADAAADDAASVV